MIYKTVRYRVKQDELEEVERAVREFVAGIAADEPQTVYEAYQTADRLTFVHFMAFPDETAEKYHQSAPHTMRFVDVLYPSCDEVPVFTDLAMVRSTRLR